MTTSLNVAEILALRRKRLNLTGEIAVLGGEALERWSLAVRENHYRGTFGWVKAKSRRRNLPLSRSAINSLLEIRATSKFTGADNLVFASSKGTLLNERVVLQKC